MAHLESESEVKYARYILLHIPAGRLEFEAVEIVGHKLDVRVRTEIHLKESALPHLECNSCSTTFNSRRTEGTDTETDANNSFSAYRVLCCDGVHFLHFFRLCH